MSLRRPQYTSIFTRKSTALPGLWMCRRGGLSKLAASRRSARQSPRLRPKATSQDRSTAITCVWHVPSHRKSMAHQTCMKKSCARAHRWNERPHGTTRCEMSGVTQFMHEWCRMIVSLWTVASHVGRVSFRKCPLSAVTVPRPLDPSHRLPSPLDPSHRIDPSHMLLSGVAKTPSPACAQ